MKKLVCFLMCLLLGVTMISSACTVSAEEVGLTLSADEENITVEYRNAPDGARLVRFAPNEYHSSASFLKEYDGVGDDCKDDGYDTDRDYYNTGAKGSIEAEALAGSGSVRIACYDAKGYDKVYDKFYLVTGGTASGGTLAGGKAVTSPRCVTSIPSARTYARTEKKSIKGLEVFMVDDAERLGISHSGVTVSLNEIFATSETPASMRIEQKANGETYYYSREYVEKLDKQVRDLTDADIEVTFVLVIWGPYKDRMPANLYHPDYQRVAALDCVAPNMVDFDAVRAWIACYEFLGDRYTREDEAYGHVNNFVVGNELSSAWSWHNMGQLPIEEFVRQYERYLRLAHTALTKAWSGVNVMVSLDNYWNSDSATDFGLRAWVNKGGYKGRDLLERFAALTREEGDFDWNVAYHPYGLDLRNPIFWDDKTLAESPKNLNAKRLTPWNIEMLPQFLAQDKMKVDGVTLRTFYFTEEGYGSPHDDNWQNYDETTYDPDNMPEKWLNYQCAAYSYAQYKFFFIGARSNITHRQFDVKSQGGNLGIWTRANNGSDFAPYKPKPVHEVMKYIDTERSLEFTSPYLKYLTFQGKTPTSWDQIIENFDESKLAVRSSVKIQQASVGDAMETDFSLGDFDAFESEGWTAGVNVSSVNAVDDEERAFAGSGYLSISYEETNYTAGGVSDKGVMKRFSEPLDLTRYTTFQVAVKVPGVSGARHTISLRFYGGGEVCEAQAIVSPGSWQIVSVDLDALQFAAKDRVDRIKIWYHTDRTTRSGGKLLLDSIGLAGDKRPETAGCGAMLGAASMGAGATFLTSAAVLFMRKRNKGEKRV